MKIEILYPEFGNLFGDSANIKYLKKCIPQAEFIETSINSVPEFSKSKVDMIYLGTMTEKNQEVIIDKLMPYKTKFEEAIKNNTVILFTGNSIEILGKYIENEDTSKITALGIFDVYSKRDMLHRKNYNILATYDNLEIVGFKSLFTTMHGNFETDYFAKTQIGIGNNEATNLEGLKRDNLIATYIIGPLLLLNPLFTKKLLNLLHCDTLDLPYEEELMTAYNYRITEFKNKFLK